MNHQHEHSDENGLAELLELDAQVLAAHHDSVAAWVAAAAGPDVRRVVDLGAGTGTGTIGLARRFPAAEIVAVDASATMLTRLRRGAEAAGVSDRVRTLQADLDDGWPALAEVDLVWAALSLHHLLDPEHTLRQVAVALRPGGLLAVVELAGAVRFLPDDLGLGRPGLEERCLAALDAEPAPFDRYPQWDDALVRAGYLAIERRSFDLTPPHPHPATGRYARGWLSRDRDRIADTLPPDDLAALDLLLDDQSPHGLLRRSDLVVRGSRTGWLARTARDRFA